jgi:hypothetical protein
MQLDIKNVYITIAAAKRITVVRVITTISGTIPRSEVSSGFMSKALPSITGCSILRSIDRY